MTKTEYGKKRRPFVSTQIILLCASSTTAFRAQQLPRSPPLLSYNSPTAQKPREPGIYLLAPSAVLSRISRELFICYFPLTCGHSMGNAQITEPASSVWLFGSRP